MNNTPLGLIDSHFHLLAMEQKGADSSSLLRSMEELAMQGIDIGIEYDDLGMRSALVAPYPNIHLSAGIGPWGVSRGRKPVTEQLKTLSHLLDKHTVCAIGEIGLDNYWGYGTKEAQQALCNLQMDMAESRNLPVIIHTREADEEMGTLLKGRTFSRRGIMHCFQGSMDLARIALSKGMYLSFAGPLTYKANTEMRRMFQTIPLDQILLETDSPYLSPTPMRGKPNTPLYIKYIYEVAASLRGLKLESFIEQIRTNFSQFLDITA